MTDHRSFHDGCQDGLKALHSLDLDQVHTFKGLVQAMGRTAFGGRRLGEALEVLTEMARTPGCFKVMSISGAMTVAKQGKIVSDLIDAASWTPSWPPRRDPRPHRLLRQCPLRRPARRHDEELFDKGYNRIYDTLEMEANLNDLAEIIAGIMDRQQRSEPWCSSAICRAIGEELDRRDEGPGILRSAYRRGVPVYIPAFTDSEMGLDLATWAMARKRGTDGEAADCFNHVPSYNPFLDLQDYAQRAIAADTLGIFTIGGGVPRNWAQQVGPYAESPRGALGISSEIKFKRRADLSRARSLGRPLRLLLQRRRQLGQVHPAVRRRAPLRSTRRRHHGAPAPGKGALRKPRKLIRRVPIRSKKR